MKATEAATAAGLEALTGEYEIDPANTRLGFTARYAMVTDVSGAFGEVSGRVRLDGEDPARSQASVQIVAASLSTGQAQRDEHLRSADFLDVSSYPELVFSSTGVDPTDPARFVLRGDLTICSTTRPVDLDVTLTGAATDPNGRRLVGFRGVGSFSRAEFGLLWNAILETGGVLVGDEVTLELDVTLVKTSVSETGRSGADSRASESAVVGASGRWWRRRVGAAR